MSYYPQPNSHISNEVRVVLDHATGVDTSDLAAKKILFLWKLKLTN